MKIVVKNKWTYLWLLTCLIAIVKFVIYDLTFLQDNILTFILQLIISSFIALIGIYFFIKFNTRSKWLNPDHPQK